MWWLALGACTAGEETEPTEECTPLLEFGDCPSGLVCDSCVEGDVTYADCNDGTRRAFTLDQDVSVELAADCAGTDDSTDTGTTETWPPADYDLAGIACGTFTVDGWALDFAPATLSVDGGVFVVDIVADGCAYRETWTGSRYGDLAFVGSACPEGRCDMPGGWTCTSTTAPATGTWTMDGATLVAEGPLSLTVGTCAAGVVTTWGP